MHSIKFTRLSKIIHSIPLYYFLILCINKLQRDNKKVSPIALCDHLHLKRYSTFVIPSINTIFSILCVHNLRGSMQKA